MTVLATPGVAESIRNKWGICALAFIDHPDGEVWVWSGVGTLRFGGNTYIGLGVMGTLSGIGGSKKLAVRALTFALTGIPSEAAKYLNKSIQDRAAKAWLAGLKANGKINGDPWQVVDGKCDYQTFEPSTDNISLALTVLEPIYSIERAQNLAFTPQWLKNTYGTELTGLDDVPGMRDRQRNWTRT